MYPSFQSKIRHGVGLGGNSLILFMLPLELHYYLNPHPAIRSFLHLPSQFTLCGLFPSPPSSRQLFHSSYSPFTIHTVWTAIFPFRQSIALCPVASISCSHFKSSSVLVNHACWSQFSAL